MLAFGIARELEWLCWCTIGHCRCNWRMKWRNVKVKVKPWKLWSRISQKRYEIEKVSIEVRWSHVYGLSNSEKYFWPQVTSKDQGQTLKTFKSNIWKTVYEIDFNSGSQPFLFKGPFILFLKAWGPQGQFFYIPSPPPEASFEGGWEAVTPFPPLPQGKRKKERGRRKRRKKKKEKKKRKKEGNYK